MENNSLSVTLKETCCYPNYFIAIVIGRTVWFRGRKYWFKETKLRLRYNLYCNDIIIGGIYIDELIIYDKYKHIINSEDMLKSLIAMFGLYPA